MFVYLPLRWKWVGAVATSALALTACTRPDEYSDLRPDGPPEVLTVSVNALDTRPAFFGVGQALEQATYCKTIGPNDQGIGDPKRPGEVNLVDITQLVYCPADLTMGVPEITSAMPEAWYVRIEFDELLDPAIEDLVADVDPTGVPTGTYTGTLAKTQPVTLKCESSTGSGLVDVPYDGYYSPSGNLISYPLGPSLVIIPTDASTIATNSECFVSLKDKIHDKDGNEVPADQRGTAAIPYRFKTAPIQITAISPKDSATNSLAPAAAGVDLTFNASISATDFTATSLNFTPTVANVGASESAPNEYFIYGDFPAAAGPFTFTIPQGTVFHDQCGHATTFGAATAANQTLTRFSTKAIALTGLAPAAEPGTKVALTFNQYMNDATLAATEYTITPALANARVEVSGLDQTKLLIAGDYALGTTYTFTLPTSATIDDCPGAEGYFAGDPTVCVKSATFSSPSEQTVTFTTASAIALKSVTPADNATVTSGRISLTFNQEMDPATFDASDYTITPPVTLTARNAGVFAYANGAAGSYETLQLSAAAGSFVNGTTYTFTLKGTASLADKLGNVYSPGTDKVIHFTYTVPAATPPHVCL